MDLVILFPSAYMLFTNGDMSKSKTLFSILLYGINVSVVAKVIICGTRPNVRSLQKEDWLTKTIHVCMCLYMILSLSHPFNGPLFGTTQVSWYQKGKTNLDFTGARDSEWQWH